MTFAAVAHRAAPRAQPNADPPRVWTGSWVEQYADPQNGVRSETTISYRLTEGVDANGQRVWTARTVQWAYRWELDREIEKSVGSERLGIERSADVRVKARLQKTCTTAGTVDLGPAPGTHTQLAMPAGQEDRLQASCTTTETELGTGVAARAPAGSGDRIGLPGIPGDEEFQGCQYAKPWRRVLADGSSYEGTYTVTRAAGVAATMLVDTSPESEYARFVPEPGRTLTFTASVSSGKARFRFELDPKATSRFPGYATNANVDDAYFEKYNLAQLRGGYANDGPDVLFDPFHFGADQWSRVEPLAVETARAQSGASVTVTVMDFAAVGALRAFVSSEDCGGWQPIPIRAGSRHVDALAIPMDDDRNFIADRLADYSGLEPGADTDNEPKGNGMAGDGLTSFEEYRGFLVRGTRCAAEPGGRVGSVFGGPELPAETYLPSDEHVRTSSRRKDVFVHAPDAELALMVAAFAEATDLAVHLICAPHYVDNDTRIVNFTLQQARFFEWGGKRLSQDGPQHGFRLEAVARLGGLRGLAIPVTEGDMGPPGLTRTVQVHKPPAHVPCGGCGVQYADVLHTVVHELAHGVGIPHHGDTVVEFRSVLGKQNITQGLSLQQHSGGPPDFTLPDSLPHDPAVGYHYADIEGRQYLNALLVAPGGDCVESVSNAMYDRNNRFIGCKALSIARRGQQNSGDFECPMRYNGSSYYEAPGSVARWAWTGLAGMRVFDKLEFGHLVDAWNGRFLRYRNDLDRDGTGHVCTRRNGTAINGLPGDQNHTGDIEGTRSCADYLVVSDPAVARRQ